MIWRKSSFNSSRHFECAWLWPISTPRSAMLSWRCSRSLSLLTFSRHSAPSTSQRSSNFFSRARSNSSCVLMPSAIAWSEP